VLTAVAIVSISSLCGGRRVLRHDGPDQDRSSAKVILGSRRMFGPLLLYLLLYLPINGVCSMLLIVDLCVGKTATYCGGSDTGQRDIKEWKSQL
jgi:hypothetical protein